MKEGQVIKVFVRYFKVMYTIGLEHTKLEVGNFF
jgi:hypothetical protein